MRFHHRSRIAVAATGRKWWPRLVKGEDESDTSKCEEGESTNLMTSSGQRIRVQRIELPERKQAKGYVRPPMSEQTFVPNHHESLMD